MKFKRRIFNRISSYGVKKAIKENSEMFAMWNLSLEGLPNLENHYATVKLSGEDLLRVRMLICAQAIFLNRTINQFEKLGNRIESHVDIGDSDGSTRILLEKSLNGKKINSLGINIQAEAVELIKSKGLEAECMDAMDLNKQNRKFDLVSVFETLEHLPNPIGFLENMQDIVDKRLLISVPLIKNSRVGLRYLTNKWDSKEIPTIANNHIFELSPKDWIKLFWHTGWRVDQEWKVSQFPKKGLLKIILKYAWRKISFEGFYFVSLVKDTRYSSRYVIE
jgi:hypothetical protein